MILSNFDFSLWNDHSQSFKTESLVLNAIRRSLLAEQVKLRLTKTSHGNKGTGFEIGFKIGFELVRFF